MLCSMIRAISPATLLSHQEYLAIISRSVNIHRDGWKLSYPIIDLNGPVDLLLSFDDFSNEINNYYYKIIHCNADWTPSSLSESEYLEGFLQNQITELPVFF